MGRDNLRQNRYKPLMLKTSPITASPALTCAGEAIAAAGRFLDSRGWAPATSGNYSVKLEDGRIAITVSGKHKGRLGAGDVMAIAPDGTPLEPRTPSAETLLHTLIYRLFPQTGAVLHTHSVNAVVLTRLLAGEAVLPLEGYELLKVFPGISTHAVRVEIPLLENSQDMPALAAEAEAALARRPKPLAPAFLIRSHGLYVWGKGMEEALRVAEATEFLFECWIKERGFRP